MKKWVFCLIILFVGMSLFAQTNDASRLVGTWNGTWHRSPATLTFNTNGTGKIVWDSGGTRDFRFGVNGSELIVDEYGEGGIYIFYFSPNYNLLSLFGKEGRSLDWLTKR